MDPFTNLSNHSLAQPRVVAVVIGQAFSTAYKEFLKSRGVTEESMEAEEYNYVLHSQVKSELEVNMLKDETKIKEVYCTVCSCVCVHVCE